MSKSTIGLRRSGLAAVATTSLVMGAIFAGAGVANADADFDFTRIAGDDRYETSADIAEAFGAADTAILASGEPGHYPDALSANFLAGVEDAPVLLTMENETPQDVLDRLEASGVDNVIIVGGELAVSAAQEQALKDAGYTVTRESGQTRFDTNAEIIAAGANNESSDTALIATGLAFPDALAGGPAAYKQGMPIGLSNDADMPDNVIAALKAANVNKAIILGGELRVPASVAAELEANDIDVVTRLSGQSRSATAVAIAEYGIDNWGFNTTGVNVASGRAFGDGADALAGGPLTGKQARPLLITENETTAGAATTYLEDHANTLTDGIIFGGNLAITQALESAMEQAARTAPASSTTRPELVGAQIVKTVATNQSNSTNPAGTYVRFDFDERVLSAAEAAFQVYRADGSVADPAAEAATVSADGMSVTARFLQLTNDSGAADGADDVDDLTVATVVPGAVTDAQGETNPEGDAAIGTAVAPGGGSSTTAGVTNAPDLVSVGGFREASNGIDTIVDFTFDEAAYLDGAATEADFNLVPVNGGAVVPGTEISTSTTAPGGATVPGGNGTTVISVRFAGDIAAATFARGYVAADTVDDTAAAGGVLNPLQAADISNGGNTTDPDLVSVAFRPDATQGTTAVDQVVYTFDQDIASPVTTLADFQVYHVDGTEVPASGDQPGTAINPTNPRQVAVNFPNGSLTNASGASVLDGAVTGTNGTTNEADEVGQAGTSGSTTGQTPGKTSGPDLTGVSIARASSDIFGNEGEFQATYTFDEDAVSVADTGFRLYLANGTVLNSVTCAEGTTEATDNTVTCSAFTVGAGPTVATSAQIGAAVLGTVTAGSVADQQNADTSTTATAGAERNVEGAEVTTGGTGTPAS